MASQAFSALDAAILNPVTNFISSASNGVSSWATTPLATAFTIYVFVYGGAILLGKITDPVSEFLVSVMRYAFILVLIGSAGHYSDWVVDLFFNSLPKEIVNALASGQAPSASAFDALVDQATNMATTLWKSAGSWDIGAAVVNGFAGILIMLLVMLMAATGYAVWIFSKIALALCLAVGPAFVALGTFQATRRFTESWLGALANYVVLQVLVVALLSMLLKVFQTQAAQAATLSDALLMLMPVGVVSLCGFYLFHQLPAIASAIVGGGASLGFGWSARRDANQSFAANQARNSVQGAEAGMRSAVGYARGFIGGGTK